MKIAVRALVVLALIVGGYFAFQRRQNANLNNQGVQQLEQGDVEGAIATFERARETQPNNPSVLRNLAKAYEQAGRGGDALKTLEKAGRRGGLNEQEQRLLDQIEDEEALRARVAARIERMESEGWKDDNATYKETMDVAQTMIDMGKNREAVILLERALYKDPENLMIELQIEELERRIAAGEN